VSTAFIIAGEKQTDERVPVHCFVLHYKKASKLLHFTHVEIIDVDWYSMPDKED
jgi:hypothetical protein